MKVYTKENNWSYTGGQKYLNKNLDTLKALQLYLQFHTVATFNIAEKTNIIRNECETIDRTRQTAKKINHDSFNDDFFDSLRFYIS